MSQGLIQGSMREAPLPDIIQLVSQGGKSGCFHVTDEPNRAKIYLKDGRIINAVSNTCEGLDAVYEVALWLDGRYHFEEGAADVPVIITKSNATVLMEMHRRMDEWRVISQKISSLDLHPASTLLPGETPHGVNPREAKLLKLITGFYTVGELADVMQKPVLTVAKDLYGLVMAGHVILKGVRSGKRPELPADMAPAPVEPPVRQAPPAPVSAPAPVSFADGAFPDAPFSAGPFSAAPPDPFIPVPMAPEPPPMTIPVSMPAAPVPAAPKPGAVTDPAKMTKLNAFIQRIVQVAKASLPLEYHDLVNGLYAKATQQVMQGDGPEAVKNLALAISKGAVDAGCNADVVKNLNAQLKALFSK